ncbi:MAG: hypothetical protein V4850_16345 [Myxococcota bacterium]
MAEHPDDFGAVRAWFEAKADAEVGDVGAKHAPVRTRNKPPKGRQYYLGAIYPMGVGFPLKIVVRTRGYEPIVKALEAAEWGVEVTDKGLHGAPRVWVVIPHARANPETLAQLVPLLGVWDTW